MYKINDMRRTKMYTDTKPPSSLFKLLRISKNITGTANIRENIPATPAYLIVLFILMYYSKINFDFMIKKFSSPKIEYELVADPPVGGEANQNSLTFPFWCPRGESNTH